ncbi:ScbA/BarX family gamma-butyrolactone biosynthesis protein [Streptacidiphilus sp. BW17]|uniref:ScbA/BarX family gamma-butyrolactone biosynthesis protein n=1 Tax=Streptacidiphilus sp. BW17 TaxID=3156274 RepID=UPI0035187A6B
MNGQTLVDTGRLLGVSESGVDPRLTFLRPVPRHLVHRAAVAEVFLTDAVKVSDDHFLVAAQWPRDHALYAPDPGGQSDPLLFAETIRQTIVYLAHEYHEVPIGHRFIGRDLNFEITEPELLRVAGAPLPLVLEATWSWTDGHQPKRHGMRLDAVLTVGGLPCGHGSLSVVAVDDRRYGMLRRRSGRTAELPSPSAREGARRLPAREVGRLRDKDSVLERTPDGAWLLDADPDHAILFDHATDHIPLMVLLEGFRQLGHALFDSARGPFDPDRGPFDAARGPFHPDRGPFDAGPGPFDADRGPGALTAVRTDCLAFAELDEPIELVAHPHTQAAHGPHAAVVNSLLIEARQDDRVIASATAEWIRSAASGRAVDSPSLLAS